MGYFLGLFWCLTLYTEGRCLDWNWQYKAHRAPSVIETKQLAPEFFQSIGPAHYQVGSKPLRPDVFAVLLLPPEAAPYLIQPLADLLLQPPKQLSAMFTKAKLSQADIDFVHASLSSKSYKSTELDCIKESSTVSLFFRVAEPLRPRDTFIPAPPLAKFDALPRTSFVKLVRLSLPG